MKKFISLLISVFALFTSCSGIFEPYGTSLTITLPGAGGRSAGAAFSVDDADFYTAKLYKLDLFEERIDAQSVTKTSRGNSISFGSLEPGFYQIEVGAYKKIGEYTVPVAEMEESCLTFELKSGEHKNLPVELQLNTNGLLNKIEDQVIELESAESEAGTLSGIDKAFAKFFVSKDYVCPMSKFFYYSTSECTREAALERFYTDLTSAAFDNSADGDTTIGNYKIIKPNTDNYIGTVSLKNSVYVIECVRVQDTSDNYLYFHSNVIKVEGKLKESAPSFIWKGDAFIADDHVTSGYSLEGSLNKDVKNWTDFAFDKNGNLYISYQVEEGKYQIVRFNKQTGGYNSNPVVVVDDSDEMRMFSDTEKDVLYVGLPLDQYAIYKISNPSEQENSKVTNEEQAVYCAKITKEVNDFVVTDGFVFFIENNNEVDAYSTGSTSTLTYKNSFSYSDKFTTINDIQVQNGKVYILRNELGSGYCRGSLIECDTGLSNRKEFFLSDEDVNDNQNTLCGPKKFISTVENKLVFADEGLIVDGSEGTNINRIITVDISEEDPEISNITNVGELFDNEYSYSDSTVAVTSLWK